MAVERHLDLARHDKVEGGQLRLVLMQSIGVAQISSAASEAQIAEAIEARLQHTCLTSRLTPRPPIRRADGAMSSRRRRCEPIFSVIAIASSIRPHSAAWNTRPRFRESRRRPVPYPPDAQHRGGANRAVSAGRCV